jgi:SAM-dependent methyltransferase
MTSDTELFAVIRRCRSCDSERLTEILDLGVTPLADRLLTDVTLREQEPQCPLTVVFCEDCSLVQIRETVDPMVLFGSDYPYYSSVSPSLMSHFRASAEDVAERRGLDCSSMVVDIASNDGYQLKNYVARGIPVLGIDPAKGPANRAIEQGVDTRIEFFTKAYAEELRAEGISADVIHANNVLAHVADTNGFVEGIGILLSDNGEVIIECPYLGDLIQHREFDTIYHQHLCYFSLAALDALFRRHNLYINRVIRTPIHGGSLRLFIERVEQRGRSVIELIAAEKREGMTNAKYFKEFADQVQELRFALRRLLDKLIDDGQRIVGYGAAAKACTLMSFVGIGDNYLDYIVDQNTFKQGRYMTGNHLSIKPVERIIEDMPDYVLILPWNFADEIIQQQSEYAEHGGRFIVPIPTPQIIGNHHEINSS